MYFSPEAEFTKLQFLILGSITNQRQAEQQWENNDIVTARHSAQSVFQNMCSWIKHLFLLSLFNLVDKGFSQTPKPIQKNSCPPFIVHGEFHFNVLLSYFCRVQSLWLLVIGGSELERVEESVFPDGWIVCRREMGAESACLFR